jgi:hypothetical protein
MSKSPPIGADECSQVIAARPLSLQFGECDGCHHLSHVKWLIDHVMVNDMRDAEIAAKKLDRKKHPGIEYLSLEKYVTLRDVAIVMTVR